MSSFENIPPQEELITRDQVVAAFHMFVERGVTDPMDLNENEPEVQAANALIDKWVAQEQARTADDSDAARQFEIEHTAIFLDAGFTSPSYVEEVEGLLDQSVENVLNPPPALEREPVSYDQALAAARSLHDNPLVDSKDLRNVRNPLVRGALEIIGFWRSQNDIPDVDPEG